MNAVGIDVSKGKSMVAALRPMGEVALLPHPAVDQSGKHDAKSTPTTKRGSPHLRKTLYQIVCTYLRKAPEDEPVYQFLDKKRAEGKPYFVYMTAAQNKFLRIYYARVKECLEAFDAQQNSTQS